MASSPGSRPLLAERRPPTGLAKIARSKKLDLELNVRAAPTPCEERRPRRHKDGTRSASLQNPRGPVGVLALEGQPAPPGIEAPPDL